MISANFGRRRVSAPRLAGLLTAAGLGLWHPLPHAQVIDELSLRREGADAVLTIRLTVPVQLRRSVNAASDELVQLHYDVLPGRERPQFVDGERRSTGRREDGLFVSVSEDGGATAQLNGRRLVVRPGSPMRMKARAGRDSRSLEVLLLGQGPALAALQAAPLATPQGVAPAAQAASAAQGLAEAALPSAVAQALSPVPLPAIAGSATAAGAGGPTPQQIEARALELIAAAQAAMQRGEHSLAVENLNEALNLPPNTHTAQAQALVGSARLAQGDVAGARREWQLYLSLYPQGAQAERIKVLLAGLPATAASVPVPAAASQPAGAGQPGRVLNSLTGSWGQSYYGGNSRTLTQLKDTPLAGQIPQVVSESTLSGTDQRLLVSMLDLNWRYRDSERDMRFVLRDTHGLDTLPDGRSQNRLSALYLDWKSLGGDGLSLRLGRQSGMGAGVLGRFDGVLAGWQFRPGWKLGVVAGRPADPLLDARRSFAGVSLDAEGLLPSLGANVYAMRQTIDGQTDRQALGTEWRWLRQDAAGPGGSAVFGQFEYDTTFKAVNVAAVQGLFTLADTTTINVQLDRRATPMLMLGNALFFAYPGLTTQPRTLRELLEQRSLAQVRQTVSDTTAFATQGLLGFSTPWSARWQWGLDMRLTEVDAIAPVPDLLPDGLPGTGKVWTLGVQAIGSNLYSARDSQVIQLSRVQGPQFRGWLASYQHMTVLAQRWQLEPSLRFYTQTSTDGVDTRRITPGVRLSWRGQGGWSLESDFSVESFRTTGPFQNERGTRLYYALGYRLDF